MILKDKDFRQEASLTPSLLKLQEREREREADTYRQRDRDRENGKEIQTGLEESQTKSNRALQMIVITHSRIRGCV